MATKGGKSTFNNKANGDFKAPAVYKRDPVTGETYSTQLPDGNPDTATNRANYLASHPGSYLVPDPTQGGRFIVSAGNTQAANSQAEQEEKNSFMTKFTQVGLPLIGGIAAGPIGAAVGGIAGHYATKGPSDGLNAGEAQQVGYNPYQGPGAKPAPGVPGGGGVAPGGAGTGNGGLDEMRARFFSDYKNSGGYVAPTVMNPGIDRTDIERDQAAEQAHLASLKAAAAGEAPSAAEGLLHNSQLDNSQNAIGMAASQRGYDGGGARRMAMRTMSDNNRRSGYDLASLRAAEMANARAGYTTALGATRTADQGLATTAAGQDVAVQGMNQQANLTGHGQNLDDKRITGGLATGVAVPAANISAAREEWQAKLKFAYDNMMNATTQEDKAKWTQVYTSLLSGAATIGAAYIGSGGLNSGNGGGSSSGGGTSSTPASEDMTD